MTSSELPKMVVQYTGHVMQTETLDHYTALTSINFSFRVPLNTVRWDAISLNRDKGQIQEIVIFQDSEEELTQNDFH